MDASEILLMLVELCTGLALFLFGMSLMSDSLAELTSGGLKKVIEKVTKNRFAGYAFGTTMTAVVQSSSTTTVMVVGFVNAGIMTLMQAAGIILGANLGSTATSWLISLNSVGEDSLVMMLIKPANLAPFIAVAAVFIMMFAKSARKKSIASVLVGFSMLMIGMASMSSAMAPLREVQGFKDLLTSFSNPFLGYLVALLFTMVVQSCDATVGILQALAASVGITYGTCIPLICGAQLGTCITSIISSIGGSRNGRRAAFIHLFYNLFKTITFLAVFYILNSIFGFSILDQKAGMVGIAAIHSLINVIYSILVLPVVGVLVKLVNLVLPLTDEEKDMDLVLSLLDSSFLKTPSFAIAQAKKVTDTVADALCEGYNVLKEMARDKRERSIEEVTKIYDRVDMYCEKVSDYATEISKGTLDNKTAGQLMLVNSAVSDFRNMSKLTRGIINNSGMAKEKGLVLPGDARHNLKIIIQAMEEIMEIAMNGYKHNNPSFVRSTSVFRDIIYDLKEKIQRITIQKFHDGVYDYNQQLMVCGILNGVDHIVACCDDIGRAVMASQGTEKGKKMIGRNDDREMQIITDLFRDKYASIDESIENDGKK